VILSPLAEFELGLQGLRRLAVSTQLSAAKQRIGTNLTYYVFEGLLVGFTGGELVHIPALSGGRVGTTAKGAQTDAVNNPYMTGLQTGYHKDKKREKWFTVRGMFMGDRSLLVSIELTSPPCIR